MNILHMQLSGDIGGIATLSREIYKYSEDNNCFVFLFEGGCVADELVEQGAKVYVLDASHIFSSKAKKQYFEICKENDIQVLVSHTGCFMEYQMILYLKKRLPGVKVVMYEHCDMRDAIGKGWKRIINLWLYKKAFRIAEAGIAISEYVKSTAIAIEPRNPDKIHVIYNGIDIRKFGYVERKRTKQMRLIYVGRMIPVKGCKLLVEAMSLLPSDIDVKLTFVGEGPEKEVCEEYAKELEIENKVIFLGQRTDVPELLSEADAFVHPAIWEEGFGLAIVEALATGLPCIAFQKGAIPELIECGYNGFYTDNITPQGIVEMIEKLYSIFKSDNFYQMSKNAVESAIKFDIINTVENLHTIYQNLF